MHLSEVFLTFLISSVIGMILAIFRMLYKSKCVKFNCCCFTVERDIEAEQEEHQFDVEHGVGIRKKDSEINM